ncbi:hypothetical protein G4L39_11155 [Limisphaera ngatamarikiensis]|uniref:CopZ zinc binding domain-containing protein n=1 Tax=Limisphaera ngatamarikiensis TaxID=1324935 RepID=A0A6M1RQL4_9BACT|nr:hypothetical protein [Limisphaera ngatamarikiensis]
MSECCSPKSSPAPAEVQPAGPMKAGCPRCGQAGRPVGLRTLKHHVRPEHLRTVEAGQFHFCRTAGCDVVYFNESGIVLTRADVRERIGLKETADPVPLCYCFGFTEKMVLDEIRATGRCTIPQRIAAEVKAGHCACEIRNPQGSCCLGEVTTVVRRLLQQVAGSSPVPDA